MANERNGHGGSNIAWLSLKSTFPVRHQIKIGFSAEGKSSCVHPTRQLSVMVYGRGMKCETSNELSVKHSTIEPLMHRRNSSQFSSCQTDTYSRLLIIVTFLSDPAITQANLARVPKDLACIPKAPHASSPVHIPCQLLP